MKLKKLKAMKTKPVNIVIGARHSGKNQNLYLSLFLDMQDRITHLNELLAVTNKALQLACEDLSIYEDFSTAKFKTGYYVMKAREANKND